MALRILQIGSGAEYGGATTYLLMLLEALKEQGWEVDYAGTPGKTLQVVRDSGYRVFPIPALQREIRPLKDWLALRQLRQVLRQEHYQVVHTHTSKGGFLGRLAARQEGIPAILHTVHGFAFHELSSTFQRKLYVRLEKTAARWCDRLITVNEEDRQQALKYHISDPDSVTTVYNGIDTRPFDGVAPSPGEKPCLLVGMVARLAPSKAPLDFVRAAALVLNHRQDVKFLLIGDGPLQSELEFEVSLLGLRDRILFTGFREDVPNLLADLDVFVLTTLWEGLPISLLEAMAMAKPVVSTRVRGPREVVEHGVSGYLVPPGDTLAMSEAILELLENPALCFRMGQAGRRLIDSRFHRSAMLNHTLQVYREVLKAKNIASEG
ncbi:MAG TPA: glycosyltransferase family 4 protein [Bacillota bacterium]|nr:glycosyltransferase family 4 protein [Bacillota bacterium]